MSGVRVAGYDLYEYWPDGTGSDFCFRYERKQDAILSLGIIRGRGGEGYINRVAIICTEREERINA